MYRALGQLVYRRPGMIIGIWVGLAGVVAVCAPAPHRLRMSEPASMLPADSEFNRAMEVYGRAFPDQASRSQIVLIFERADGLRTSDRQVLGRLAGRLAALGEQTAEQWRVRSSSTHPLLRYRLDSPNGQAALILVDLDVNFMTHRASEAVAEVERVVREGLPVGLDFEVTGSAGIGRDYNYRSRIALERTTKVTILAVLIILVVVYRSLVGALVPLLSIGLSVYIAFGVLDFLALLGWSVSNAERTFTVVLLFGAGTNYALFWISRYHEELTRGRRRSKAAVDSTVHVAPAILASAGTTILGLMMLSAADMLLIHNAGKVLWMVLSISMLAATTLTPAMAVLLGSAFFWPARGERTTIGQRTLWPRVASEVVRRPVAVLIGGLIVLAVPAWASWTMPYRYDSFGEVAENSSSARGLKIARRNYAQGELFPTRFLVQSDELRGSSDQALAASNDLALRLRNIPSVSDVWHLGAPLGGRRNKVTDAFSKLPIAQEQAEPYYFSRADNMLLVEIMLRLPALSDQSARVFRGIQRVVETWAGDYFGQHHSYAVGQTAYIADIKAVADRDLNRIIGLVVAVIWLVVVVLIRRLWLSLFMLAATLLTFGTAMGLTHWLFVGLLGEQAIDYKVKVFVFVIIVAAGQDYNIFLITRVLEEARSYVRPEAVTRAIVVTGPVISSCGLIMAAALGSLVSSGLDLTKQLGFAFAAGILIDTFVVRPLLIPSFYLLVERGPAGPPGGAAGDRLEPPARPVPD